MKRVKRRRKSALRRESERGLVLQIRRNLALPMEQRTNFLRKRLARGSAV